MSARALLRAEFRSGALAVVAIAAALAPFGVVCGVAAAKAGASPLAAFGLSAIVFSGAAQIVVTEPYAAGAPVAVIVLTCFVVGLRLALYRGAVAPHVQTLPPRWRNQLAYVVTDQVFAGSSPPSSPGSRAAPGGRLPPEGARCGRCRRSDELTSRFSRRFAPCASKAPTPTSPPPT